MSSAKSPASSATPRLADRYVRCEDFAARIDGIELAPEVWAVFAQLTQSRNAPELAQTLQLDVEAVNASLRRLVRRKLVRKHVLGWRDYTATQAPSAASPAPTTPLVPPAPTAAVATDLISPPFTRDASPLLTPNPVGPSATPTAPAAPLTRSPIISLRISNPNTSAQTAPAISFRIAASPRSATPSTTTPGTSASAPSVTSAIISATPLSNSPGIKLRPVLDAIGAKAGGGVAGQLLVYRVFLQIPTELMQAAGLHSLSLVDDHFTVQHPPLRAALADAARRHADVDIDALVAA
ncbi:MAG: hypothetical protein ABW223_07010 [Rariglobus sp.]